jgi:hypothetical protein
MLFPNTLERTVRKMVSFTVSRFPENLDGDCQSLMVLTERLLSPMRCLMLSEVGGGLCSRFASIDIDRIDTHILCANGSCGRLIRVKDLSE